MRNCVTEFAVTATSCLAARESTHQQASQINLEHARMLIKDPGGKL